MTIGDLWEALRRFWGLALGLFVAILGLGVAEVVLRADTYRSEAVLAVEPVRGGLSFETSQAVQLIIPPTIARVEAPAFVATIRPRVTPAYRGDPLTLSATNDPGTSVINVAVESASPPAALSGARAALTQLERNPPSRTFKIAVLSPPGAATSVRAQRAPPIIGGSLVLGLLVGLMAAATAHLRRPMLPRAEQFRERYDHEILAEIPSSRKHRKGLSTAETFNGRASAAIVEAFTSLETRLARRIASRGDLGLNVSIAVTSWGKLEGKSTVVTNLAWTMASYGRDVTVVDCDMRQPSVHTLLDIAMSPGVADIADGKAVMSICQPTALESLDVIAAGSASRHPARLTELALPRLLSALSQRLVLVDTPPMFTPEAMAIASQTDFILLVADYCTRRPDEISEALADLELTGTPVLGVVLNRVDVPDTRGRDSYLFRPEQPVATPSKPSKPSRPSKPFKAQRSFKPPKPPKVPRHRT